MSDRRNTITDKRQRYIMNTRDGRRVHVSFRGNETTITLAWYHPKDEGGRGFKIVDMHYSSKAELDRVGQALDILVPHWAKIYMTEYSRSVVSCELDKDPILFDAITDNIVPADFFVSDEVLKYCGGKSASMRLWDIEFSEKYAELIAFNRQALAAK